ncbi:MAG TPA: serine/threonine-protein kinase [Candidatus Kryptonia bacterium]|nr:serine/threonine-protein kinase [Candidatus Kryptonia bacterium]
MSWLDKIRARFEKPRTVPSSPRHTAGASIRATQASPLAAPVERTEPAASAQPAAARPSLRLTPSGGDTKAESSPEAPATWATADSRRATAQALKLAPRPAPTRQPPASIPSFSVGDRIADRYEVTRVVATEGTWAVYLTHHDRWGLDVIVKIPAPELADVAVLRALAGAADDWIALGMHLHVAYCHCVHPLAGVPMVVIEHAQRGNLRQWLAQRENPDLRTALDFAVQCCHGLEHAHSRGLIHRALRAENVLLAGDGTLKLSDFGIAAAQRKASVKLNAGTNAFGPERKHSPPYVAPEQWVDEDGVDARADIFALGVCLYELLCGRRPFDLARGPRREPPDPRELWRESWRLTWEERLLPARACKLLMRCVDWDRERRPWSVTEVRQELAAIYANVFAEPSRFAQLPNGSPEADGWNNRALAHLMLDRASDADAAWEAALAADRHHIEATYNRGLSRWRRAQATDHALVEQLQQLRPPRGAQWRAKYVLALVHLERGAVDDALPLLDEAARDSDDAEVAATLSQAQAGELANASCLGVIEGHSNYVTAAAVTSDGRLAVSASHDHTLRVWDVPTGRCLRVLEGHRHHVLAVALTSDGRLAISGADEEPLRLWEITSGRCVRVFEGADGRPYGVALSGDGRLAISTGAQGSTGVDVGAVQVWDAENGKRRAVLQGHTSHVKAVSITPDGRFALSGSDDRTARLWEVATERCVHVLEGHQHHVSAVYVTADGQWAVTGGWDETVRLWELTTARCIRTFVGHPSLVTAVHMLAEARRVLSGSWDRTLRLWDMDSGRCLRTFEGHRGMVTSVHLLAGGRRALSASWDMSLRLWQTPEATTPEVCRLRASRPVTYAAVAPQRTLIATQPIDLIAEANQAIGDARYGAALEALHAVRARNGDGDTSAAREAWRRLSRHCERTALHAARPAAALTEPDAVCAAALSSSGRWVVSGSRDGSVRLWDPSTSQCVQTWDGHTDRVTCVQLSADEHTMLSGSADRTVRLWDVDAGFCQRIFTGHTSLVTAVALSTTGRWALSGSYDHTVRLWEVSTGQCARIFSGHSRQVSSVALNRDGRQALSGAYDRTVRLWDLTTGRCVLVFEGHRRAVTCVQFGADGTTAISGSDDGSVRIWEIASGRCLQVFEGHSDHVTAARLSLDGRWAVSTGRDRTVRVWDVPAQRCHAMLEDLPGAMHSVALSDDACWLAGGGADNILRVWELEWELEARDAIEWDERARPHLATFLTLHPPLRLDAMAGTGANRRAEPSWNEHDFQRLMTHLQCVGCGWLRPEGVRRELDRMLDTCGTAPTSGGAEL